MRPIPPATLPLLLAWASPPLPAQVATNPDDGRIAAVIERLVSGDREQVAVAKEALLSFGRAAVAPLMKVARPDGILAATPRALQALEVIGALGPDGVEVFDDLVEALPTCGQDTFLPLLRALGDLVPYSPFQREPDAVIRLVKSNRLVVEGFRQHNDRQRFQFEYNRFLKRAQVDAGAGLEAMIAELEANRTHRREVAAEVVGRMGPPAKAAVQALVNGLRKGAPVVGQIGGFSVPKYRDRFPAAATRALIRIAPRDPRVAIAWGWQLDNSASEEMRMQAVLRIGAFGSGAAEQVPELVRALRDPSLRVRNEVISALGMIGPGAKAAIPPLEKLLAGEDKATAARAGAALGRIREK